MKNLLVAASVALLGTSVGPAAENEPKESPVAAKRKPNRLAGEKSPYLLQHAHNPVDWHPWGSEAFEKARSEGKAVFLSIGYSTCHWCHVMERESFEDAEIAAYLNGNFVSIKVDREERPDVDAVYMDFVQASTGSGGWPLSVFLTPEGKPFFGGTYFPPRDDPTRGTGFLTIIQEIQKRWGSDRQKILDSAGSIRDVLAARAAGKGAPGLGRVEKGDLRRAYEDFRSSFDEERAGFAGPPRHAPKFPRTTALDFLLRASAGGGGALEEAERREALRMVEATLDAMLRGGIRDHLAGGFHRYSTDREWLVPHFEKMLYDQAIIARTLVDAWRVLGKDAYREAARETLDYVLARMRGPDGEIHSAEDADTDGVEGKTYVWRRVEVLDGLGNERGTRFAEVYGVTEAGNFPEGGEGSNVLHIALAIPEAARKFSMEPEALARELAEDRSKLLAVRDRRPQPFRDDKVLTEWNGLAISALAHVHQATGDARYLDAARSAAVFLLQRMVVDGKLKRRHRLGEVRIDGFLEDHAFLIEGLLDLYEASFDSRFLEEAIRLGREMVRLFWDAEGGGFFSSGTGHEALITRIKEFYDGAVPSGNSVAYHDLLRLAEMTGDREFVEKADVFDGLVRAVIVHSPESYPRLLSAAHFRVAGPKEIVIAGAPGHALTESFRKEMATRFLPAKVVLGVDGSGAPGTLVKLVPLLEGKQALGGSPTAFVCRGGVCKLPARDIETFRAQLAE